MHRNVRRFIPVVLSLVALLLVACGGPAAPAVETAGGAALAGTATARAANAALTPAPAPTENPLGGSQTVPASRDANGTYFLGDPNAPVVITDHSDFL